MILCEGSKRDTDIENRLWDTVGGSGMTGENSTETYTLPYVKQIASGSLMYDEGHPKPVLCDHLEGGVRWERSLGGRDAYG